MTSDIETAPPRSTTERLLIVVVIALAVLILAGLAAVAWRVLQLGSGRASQPAAAATAPSAAPAPAKLPPGVEIALPAGAEVSAMALDGDRLAVHYRAGAEKGIAIIEIGSGRELGRLRLVPEAGR
ncbi:MAG: hypothetical protein AB1749_11540 [Pseudomonadota bacterium]